MASHQQQQEIRHGQTLGLGLEASKSSKGTLSSAVTIFVFAMSMVCLTSIDSCSYLFPGINTSSVSLFAEARGAPPRGNRASVSNTRKSSRSSNGRLNGTGTGSSGRISSSNRSRKRSSYDEDYGQDDDVEDDSMSFGFLDEYDKEDEYAADDGYDLDPTEEENYFDNYDMEEEEEFQTRKRRPTTSTSRGDSARSAAKSGRRGSSVSRRSASSSSSRRQIQRQKGPGNRRSGNVVPYNRQSRGGRRHQPPPPSAFVRGLTALRESIPDPSTLKDSAINSLSAARESTSKLTSNIYREVKGLTSSELEQVMLKATAPNDTPVKGKHVERLVGVTYQISGRYDIYDAVLRKLWSKMVEKDWRTTVKALYILHRFSADGAPDHQAALKARLRELRRTRDPKRGKEKYFNSKQLLSGDTNPATVAFRAFLSRYAHYVLLRAQCFGGMFTEIANDPNQSRKGKSSSKSKSSTVTFKSITTTCLKNEHLEASKMLLKAGVACSLKGGEECENTAIAVERVVSDLIGLTTAVATALSNALKGDYDSDADMDWTLIKEWCEFYSNELLVQTKSMIKTETPALDTYGLFLPSRIGASLSQDLLQKGLRADEHSGVDVRVATDKGNNDMESEADADTSIEKEGEDNSEDGVSVDSDREKSTTTTSIVKEEEENGDNDNDYDEYDAYEYDEEYDFEE